MARKAAVSDYVALDGNKCCICPFCGTRSRVNGLPFRSDRLLPAGTDFVLDKYLMDFGLTGQNDLQGLAATTTPAVLYDWRSFDVQDVAVDQGVVFAITDLDGREYRERVCPWCHNVLPGWVYTLPSMICLTQNPADAGAFIKTFDSPDSCSFAGQMIIRNTGEWVCYLLSHELPTALPQRQREANLCHEADRMIIFCRLDETPGVERTIDEETQVWMQDFLRQRFSNQTVGCKTLVIIRTREPIGIDELRTKHNILYAHINAHFPSNRIQIWMFGQDAPPGLSENLEWLTGEK